MTVPNILLKIYSLSEPTYYTSHLNVNLVIIKLYQDILALIYFNSEYTIEVFIVLWQRAKLSVFASKISRRCLF